MDLSGENMSSFCATSLGKVYFSDDVLLKNTWTSNKSFLENMSSIYDTNIEECLALGGVWMCCV